MVKKQSYVIWIQIVSLGKLNQTKQMIFRKILQKMLKLDLIPQIISYIEYCLKKKNKKVIVSMKDELGRKIMAKFVTLREKTYRYLVDDSS